MENRRKILDLLILSLLFFSCGQKNDKITAPGAVEKEQSFVIGGEKVLAPMHQSVVALVGQRNKVFCGGNLIEKKQIVTAAHCLFPFYDNGVNEKRSLKIRKLIIRGAEKEVAERLRLGLIKKSELPAVYDDLTGMRVFFKIAIKKMILKKAKSIGLHFGDGFIEGKPTDVLYHQVKHVHFSRYYLDYIFETYFKYTRYYEERLPQGITQFEVDKVVLVLENEIDHVEPIPLLSANDFRRYMQGRREKQSAFIKLVGFGDNSDRNNIVLLKKYAQLIDKMLATSRLNTLESNKLTTNKNILLSEIDRLQQLLKRSGEKKMIDIKIKKIESYMTASNNLDRHFLMENVFDERINKNKQVNDGVLFLDYYSQNDLSFEALQGVKATCYGDSGSPAFVETALGTFQVGVLSTLKGLCRKGVGYYSLFDRDFLAQLSFL